MDDPFDDRQPTDTRSAYDPVSSPFNTSPDELNAASSWGMVKSFSAYPQPQQHPAKQPNAWYAHRHSLPQNVPRQPRRSFGQASDINAMSAANFMGNSFTGPSSAPVAMAPPHSIDRYLRDDQSGPFYAARSSIQPVTQQFMPNFTQWRGPLPSHSELASEDVPPLTAGEDSTSASLMPQSVYSEQLQTDTRSFHELNPGSSLQQDDTTTILSSERSGSTRRRKVRSEPRRQFIPTKCEHCDEVPKTSSEHRKHMLKHLKTFHCQVPGCPRDQPFGTSNDRDRHERSVHKRPVGGKMYKCPMPGCEKSDKLWPRYDNFKTHVNSVHKEVHKQVEERVKEICKQAQVSSPEAPPAPQPPQAMPEPMSTALAGIVGGQPAQPMHPPSMQYPMNPDLLSPGAMPMMDMQPDHHHLQGTGFLDHLSPLESASDRLSKAGPTLVSTLPPTDRREGGVAKRRRRSSPSGGAIAVLADAALGTQAANAGPHPSLLPNDAARRASSSVSANRSRSRSTSRHSDVRLVLPDDEEEPSQLDQLLQQLKSHIGEEGLVDALKQVSSKAGAQWKKRQGAPNGIPNQCRFCDKVLARPCDLKKHETRHYKPYGCTFPNCNKEFGSKNDWKRHENSQHFQPEMWRCQFEVAPAAGGQHGQHHQHPAALGGKCGHFTWSAKRLKAHLRKAHEVLDERRASGLAASWRIGRSGQNRYWCGYCRDIIAVNGEVRGQAAWDERFNHIDRHIKEGRAIHDWLCIEAKLTKGEVEAQGGAGAGGADKPKTTGARPPASAAPTANNSAGEDDSTSEDEQPAPRAFPPPPSSSSAVATAAGPRANAAQQLNSFSASATLLPPASGVQDGVMYTCCRCGSGPYNEGDTKCMMNALCDHELCFQCMM